MAEPSKRWAIGSKTGRSGMIVCAVPGIRNYELTVGLNTALDQKIKVQ